MEPKMDNVRTLQAWLHGRWVDLNKNRHQKRAMLRNVLSHTPVIHYRLTVGTPGRAALGYWANDIAPLHRWQLAPTGTGWIVAADGWGQPSRKGGSDVRQTAADARPPTHPPYPTKRGQEGALATRPTPNPARGRQPGEARTCLAQSASIASRKRCWGGCGEAGEALLLGPELRQQQGLVSAPIPDLGSSQGLCSSSPGPEPSGLRYSPLACAASLPYRSGLHQNRDAAEDEQRRKRRRKIVEKISLLKEQAAVPYEPVGGRPCIQYHPKEAYRLQKIEVDEGREPLVPRPPRREWSPSRAPADPRITADISPSSPTLPPHLRYLFSPVFTPEPPAGERPDRGPAVGQAASRQLVF